MRVGTVREETADPARTWQSEGSVRALSGPFQGLRGLEDSEAPRDF